MESVWKFPVVIILQIQKVKIRIEAIYRVNGRPAKAHTDSVTEGDIERFTKSPILGRKEKENGFRLGK